MTDENKNTRQLDMRSLTPEQRDRLDSYNQATAQIAALKDIATKAEDIFAVLESQGDNTDLKDMGTVLLDIRESLTSLNSKEQPEQLDTSKPVVEAMSDLEKALTKAIQSIDVKPQVKVDAPQVNVNPPHVDLKGIEKVLKTDIPAAFKKAIASIPVPEKPDNTQSLKIWQDISEQLQSIDTATRMKPLPGVMKVTNTDGTGVGNSYNRGIATWEPQPLPLIDVAYDYIGFTDADANGNYQTWTFNTGGSGGTTVRTLSITYDASSNITSIARS